MKLQRLEISGFKSFVEPVSTSFSGGITAIVGPNGCGKSNFAEAVTWVLGEQSAKTLRGGTMEDVIFGGSESRKPLGMAEVTLTLLADDSLEAAEGGKITLGRRVFRSGESQYRLNDKLVRLKEIKDLLMDTGLGIRAYSVIEQGRIGMILSGKPQERRKLIEEAAGVTRYKARKRVAEVKLEDATANLMRLDDIISEVERALRSLKRQANAATRFQERQAAYRELLEVVLLGRWATLDAELRALRSTLGEHTDQHAAITAELHGREATLVEARERLDELGDELASRHKRQAELAATIEGRQEFIKGARQTVKEICERLEQGQGLAEQRQAEMADHLKALETLDDKHRELILERDDAVAAVEQDRRQIADAEQALAVAEGTLEGLRAQLMSSLGKVNSLQNRVHEEQIEGEKVAYRRDHLAEDLRQREEALDSSRSRLEEAARGVRELEGRLGRQLEARSLLQVQLEEALRLESEASHRRQELQEELRGCRQRESVLEELASADAQRRTTLTESLVALGLDEPRFLADEIAVPEGWESSLDLYLEQLRDAVLVAEDQEPLELARHLAAGRSQGILVSTRRVEEGEPLVEAPEDEAIVSSLGEALALGPELAAALPPAYLVRSPEDAERLAQRHPSLAFISRDRLWTQAGVVHLQGEQARPGVLSRRRELDELAQRTANLKTGLEEADQAIERLVGERTDLAGRSHQLDGEIATARQELAVAQARHQDLANRQGQLEGEHQAVSNEAQELAAKLERVRHRHEQLKMDLVTAQGLHRQLETKFDAAEAEVASAREQREALRTEGAGRQGRLQLLKERLDSHGNESRRLARQREELRLGLERWQDEARNLDRRRDELETGIQEAETQLQAALEGRADAEESTTSGQERLEAQRGAVKELDVVVNELRARREEAQQQLQELHVRRASLEQEAEHLREAYGEEFSNALPDEPTEAPENLEEIEGELAQLKATLERMGPVNVLAAEEYAEQLERHGFLTEQRADVAASVDQLRRTIREINLTSSERFRATFSQVNENFGAIFADLFRGGEAEMRLLDEDDPLDSGIEIVARPPGKRLQNLMLLSGGEKALTAIALLFALFKTKPSPFCILDEVDAPLDDTNILRFVQVLKEMSKDTQFLIITHNKLTMEVAGSLYGVTMQEKGVSQLVAVDVDELHPESDLLPATVSAG